MTYWQHTPPDVHLRLIELANLYAGCREIYFDLVDEMHWQPTPKSAAAADAAALPDATTVDGIRLLPSFLRLTDVISSYLQVASGHLGGLAALHASEEVMFPSGMLVRAVLENCAHVIWVLGAGGEEPPTAKLARVYLEERISAEEAKKNAGRMGDKTGVVYQDAVRTWKELHTEIYTRFPTATAEELGKKILDGQQFLSPETCVQEMYTFFAARTESAIDPRVGVGAYGYLCNVTHPTLYPVRELREWIIDADGHDHATSVSRLPIEFLERQASVAVVPFLNVIGYMTSYFGWPITQHNRLADLIDTVLPGTIAA